MSYDGWADSWSESTGESELGATAERIPRGRFMIQCAQCGRLSEDYGTEQEAHWAFLQHAVDYHVRYDIVAV
jgi:hypothetical protein